MANPSSVQTWNSFFLSAGIPNVVAHQYAVTFSSHRMSIDMLREITKDILIDMGIKAMGDIIAILRHAKILCAQDELKIGTTSSRLTSTTSTSDLRAPGAANIDVVNATGSLAQRMPISTNRSTGLSKSSTSASAPITTTTTPTATVGNKIQSRLSLKSGALMASTNAAMEKFINSSNGNLISTNGKRSPSSNISAALAKRLKPQADLSHSRDDSNGSGRQVEKTLTVRYPSSQAIARAQQRISSHLSSSTISKDETTTLSNKPIRSRLGIVKTPVQVKLKPTMTTNNDDILYNNDSSQNKSHHIHNNAAMDHRGYGRDRNISRGHRNKDGNLSVDNGSPIRSHSLATKTKVKSTVFHRLGGNPRR